MNIERKRSFDATAELYDRIRPGYPDSLFDDLVALSGLPAGGTILDVGCGTGQATLPMARRGYRILALDLGANMVAVARRKLAAFPVDVLQGSFEQVVLEPAGFDLLISATAWHWIDPAERYGRAAELLRDGGALGVFWNEYVKIDADGDFSAMLQPLYRRYAPALAAKFRNHTAAQIQPNVRDDIDRKLFGPVAVRRYEWQHSYDARAYTELLSTYSDHLSLAPDARAGLLDGIADVIDTRFGGSITKGYLSTLYVAHKLDPAAS